MTEEPLRATVSQRGVVFAPNGDVLLVRRGTDGGWELPGGRLGAEEEAPAGVRREIAEETGLEPTVGRPIHATAWRNDADRGRFAVYYCCRVAGRSVSLSDEHVGHEWVSPVEARERLSEPQGTAVGRALDAPEPPLP
ncbi:MAG: NUDIX domain-containing protein [Haloarculaceae archaeon]